MVAAELGYTVQEIEERMTIVELVSWADWFAYKAEQEAKAMKEAQRKSGGGGRPRPSRVGGGFRGR